MRSRRRFLRQSREWHKLSRCCAFGERRNVKLELSCQVVYVELVLFLVKYKGTTGGFV